MEDYSEPTHVRLPSKIQTKEIEKIMESYHEDGINGHANYENAEESKSEEEEEENSEESSSSKSLEDEFELEFMKNCEREESKTLEISHNLVVYAKNPLKVSKNFSSFFSPFSKKFPTKEATVLGTKVVVESFPRLTGGKVEEMNTFERQVKELSNIRHENLLLMIGFSLNPPLLISENVELGSFRSLLDEKSLRITHDHVFKLLLSVAKGVNYLHSMTNPKTFGGNLTSSSIYVSKDWNSIKLTHFGLSASSQEEEGIDLDSSIQRDVKDYGNLIWECVTRKKVFVEGEAGGEVPFIPAFCPPFMEELMLKSWQVKKEEENTSFFEILKILKKMKKWMRNCKGNDGNSVLERDLQSIHFHSPQFDTESEELKVKYCRRFGMITPNTDIVTKFMNPIWRSMKMRNTEASFNLFNSFGAWTSLVFYNSLEEVREADFFSVTVQKVVQSKLEEWSSIHPNRTLLESNLWDVKEGAEECRIHRFRVPEGHERSVRRILHNQCNIRLSTMKRYCGTLFLYDHEEREGTAIYLLKSDEEQRESIEPVIQNIRTVLQSELGNTFPSHVEDFKLSYSWYQSTVICN
eukprot:TRINITY_DN2460_c0_g1_i2.p1 TRINITY_DN2460_c0_g1~~TRINITY_DN2460_c0_g1_i2.p1  ORF type:complete len:579 (+),score=200.15 TRINITY_DN2460_c0_g1_i2:175-1911(+)